MRHMSYGAAVPGELQRLIDDLADRLNVPISLEDPNQHLLASSVQHGTIDDVRRQTVLGRRSLPDVRAWFESFGVREALDPVRIPADPVHSVLARLCVPIRHRDRLIALLWLIDPDAQLGDTELAVIRSVAGHVALLLGQSELAERMAGDTFRHLVSPVESSRKAAQRELTEHGGWSRTTPMMVVVAEVAGPADDDSADAVGMALADPSRLATTDVLLRFSRAHQASVLAPARSSPAIAERLMHALAAQLPGRQVSAGIGDPVTALADVHHSFRQARRAAHVAATVPNMGPIVSWGDLGVFRALTLLPADEIGRSALDPRLVQLLDAGEPDLVVTLEQYLDLAGDAQATAAALHIHRSTLYHRLGRIETITGTSLRSGGDRLALHLGLKLVKLSAR